MFSRNSAPEASGCACGSGAVYTAHFSRVLPMSTARKVNRASGRRVEGLGEHGQFVDQVPRLPHGLLAMALGLLHPVAELLVHGARVVRDAAGVLRQVRG